MGRKNEIVTQLQERNIFPIDSLGQHILINKVALDVFSRNTIRGGNVLEIGAGPGNITERIAEHAKKVVAIETDRRFEPILFSNLDNQGLRNLVVALDRI